MKVILIWVILIELYCQCLWNMVSCEHSRYSDCLLGNNERRFTEYVVLRQADKSRRQGFTLKPHTFTHQGPPRSPEYDPTFGYEPYWATGDWVFEKPPLVQGDMCGQVCSPYYMQYGVICGRRRDKKLSMEHKTFSNYCAMMNEDCNGKDVWLIAYRGACREPLMTVPNKGQLFRSRALYYITAFMSRYPYTIRLTSFTKRRSTITTTKSS